MIKIIQGKYKNISMRVDENFDVIVKAPKRVGQHEILSFITKHSKWITNQQKKILQAHNLLKMYDFDNSIYVFGIKKECKNSNKIKEYINLFDVLIGDLVGSLAVKYNFEYNSLSLTNSKRVWGCMDRNKNIKLNLKLIILRKELVEYVILHELCHGKEFNHSKKFWGELEKCCPDYKRLNKELKSYAIILTDKRVFG